MIKPAIITQASPAIAQIHSTHFDREVYEPSDVRKYKSQGPPLRMTPPSHTSHTQDSQCTNRLLHVVTGSVTGSDIRWVGRDSSFEFIAGQLPAR